MSSNNTVDAWYLTHYHKDHTGALAKYLLENDNSIKTKNIYIIIFQKINGLNNMNPIGIKITKQLQVH